MASTSPGSALRSPAAKSAGVSDKHSKPRRRKLLTLSGVVNGKGLKADQATRSKATAALSRLPVIFEPNEGQADPRVEFLTRNSGLTMLLERDGAVLALPSLSAPALPRKFPAASLPAAAVRAATRQPKLQNPSILRMTLVGENQRAQVSGEQPLPGKSNYLIGNNPHHWRTNIPQFARVRYHDVYPGVDLVYYGNSGQLEYDFVVAPGADPGMIRLSFKGLAAMAGGSSLRLDPQGNLIVQIKGKQLEFHKPVVYQPSGGSLAPIGASNRASLPRAGVKFLSGRFLLARSNQISFALDSYDRTKPLVIDPTLTYSTYLGGSNNDQADDVVLDSAGNIYIVGTTASGDFPKQNAEQSTCSSCLSGSPDAFITEMSADGTKLIFSTFLGGSAEDDGNGIAADPSGNIYVTGRTFSADFPVPSTAYQPNCSSCSTGSPDAYVAELPPGGASLT
ncbi:MAG: SBBP repeat-containing protein, partial [Terriglobia bacterium]